MAVKRFVLRHKPNPAVVLHRERHLLNKYYDFLDIKLSDGRALYVEGYCQPSEYSITYTYKIKFTPGEFPKVRIISPAISYSNDIHMYKEDRSLCLFYPKDFSWTNDSNLYNTIVPWTHEWFLFFELYLIKGKWLHPYVEHNTI